MANLQHPSHAVAVTPHDSNNLGQDSILYIGGAGSAALKVTTAGGQDIAFAGVTVGWFPLRVKRVWSTGTDVTAIIAVW